MKKKKTKQRPSIKKNTINLLYPKINTLQGLSFFVLICLLFLTIVFLQTPQTIKQRAATTSPTPTVVPFLTATPSASLTPMITLTPIIPSKIPIQNP